MFVLMQLTSAPESNKARTLPSYSLTFTSSEVGLRSSGLVYANLTRWSHILSQVSTVAKPVGSNSIAVGSGGLATVVSSLVGRPLGACCLCTPLASGG
ncbi:hypothetical protein EVAR_16509_1 [Eumeta japonica]|uniref:Uncharacterized protein n=1 Tax=Eumeta variegata TaxID=151549 RepID=A0A4C1U3F7_EUMVA|nr:hypothetical protein EVAR_16509_1 [Eumeta japonica]